MPGISCRGCTTLPPPSSIRLMASPIAATSIVITGDGVSSERFISPPLTAPRSVGICWYRGRGRERKAEVGAPAPGNGIARGTPLGHDGRVQAPETRYTKNDDAHIAYQVVGDGPVDLLFVPEWLNHVDEQWEEPRLAGFLRGLIEFSRLILFNPRGMGASDPIPTERSPLADEWMGDAVAALDAAGSERAAVLGTGAGGTIALLLAGSHPERVSSLVVFNTAARAAWAEDYPIGMPAEYLRQAQEFMRAGYPSAAILPMWAPDLVGNEAFERWIVRYQRICASPGTALAVQGMLFGLDVRAALPAIQAPTLVLHRAGNPHVGANHGAYIAEHVAGAEYRELPGAAHAYWAGNPAEIVAEVREFLTGVREPERIDRVLATVLFTDIVGSTERAAELGDRSWRELLERHHAVVRRELVRFRGREVSTAGDGFLATFDGPARAIACAMAIRDAVRPLGVEVRAGLHAGEIELRGDDVAGIAVHIGSRVSGLAAPSEVLVSRTLVDLVAGSDLRFEERGTHALKGVPGEWALFAVVGDE
jgi:class 3 adenylate cyclase